MIEKITVFAEITEKLLIFLRTVIAAKQTGRWFPAKITEITVLSYIL